MRITSIRVEPVARILAIIYALFGFASWLWFAFTNLQYLTLPFGVVAPFFHLNLNLNLGRSGGFYYNVLLCLGAVLSYCLTGWLTGAAAALCFNFSAKKMGGIDATYFTIIEKQAKFAESTR